MCKKTSNIKRDLVEDVTRGVLRHRAEHHGTARGYFDVLCHHVVEVVERRDDWQVASNAKERK